MSNGTKLRPGQRNFSVTQEEFPVKHKRVISKTGKNKKRVKFFTRRYDNGIKNLFSLYIPLCEYWMIINNSTIPQELIAEGGKNMEPKIYNKPTYNKIANYERTRD